MYGILQNDRWHSEEWLLHSAEWLLDSAEWLLHSSEWLLHSAKWLLKFFKMTINILKNGLYIHQYDTNQRTLNSGTLFCCMSFCWVSFYLVSLCRMSWHLQIMKQSQIFHRLLQPQTADATKPFFSWKKNGVRVPPIWQPPIHQPIWQHMASSLISIDINKNRQLTELYPTPIKQDIFGAKV